MPPRFHLTIYGPFQLFDDVGADLTPRIRKSRALLAILAAAMPATVPRDRIAGLLWSRRDRDQGRASLRQCVHELQSILGARAPLCLIAERNHLGLDRAHFTIDQRAVGGGAQRFLADLDGLDPAFDRWLLAERQRLGRAAIAAAESFLLHGSGPSLEPPRAIAEAEMLLAIDPAHEPAWRVMIAAHLSLGRRDLALQAWESCVAALAERNRGRPQAATEALVAGPSVLPSSLPAVIAPPQRRLRLGVRPFRNLDGTTDDPLALGLAEDITTALSRFRWFFLVANPSLVEPGAMAAEDRWQRPGPDYALDGTIQRAGGRVRISARLLDMLGGPDLVWASRFEHPDGDTLAIQDEMAAQCAARIDPAVMIHEGTRAGRAIPPPNDAYSLTMAAIPAIYRLIEAPFRLAGTQLAEAIRLDPDYGPAHTWFACWHLFLVGQSWAEDPAAAMANAAALADRAIVLDAADARAFTIAGHVKAFLHHRVDEALRLHERALSLNPNLTLAWSFAALADCYRGDPDAALRRVEHARRLSPFDPHAFFLDMATMLAHLVNGDDESVVAVGHQSLTLNPSFTSAYKIALSALGHLGRESEIAPLRARLLEIEPRFSVSHSTARTPLQRREHLARYAAGLLKAGLPE